MFDVVKFLVRIAYYYSRLLGALNLEIDLKAGRGKHTTRASIYAALMNVLAISILPFLSSSQILHFFVTKSSHLQEIVFRVMLGGRVLSVIVTLHIGWWQRQRILRIVNAIIRLTNKRPRVRRMWRRAVISKFTIIILTEAFQLAISLFIVCQTVSLRVLLCFVALFAVTELSNIMLSHYYFALLNIHGHYVLLNEELRTLLAEASSLEAEQRKGVFAIKCCALADRIESVASTQFQLQTLLQWITDICGFQTLFITTSMYSATVGYVYCGLSQLSGSTISITWTSWKLTTLLAILFVWFFIDAYITMNMMYSVLAQHKEMVKLLSQSALFAAGLDQRLDMVLESFKLQLACHPLEISILGLYNVEKPRAMLLLNSIVSCSLVIVQYDVKNDLLRL